MKLLILILGCFISGCSLTPYVKVNLLFININWSKWSEH